MSSKTEAIQLPSGSSVELRALTTHILRIERESETVIHGSGGGGKIREKRALFSDRYEVRGDIKPIQIGSYTEHKQRIWYQDGGRQTYLEVFNSQASGLEGHELVLVLKDGASVVGAHNIDANETIVWGPFVPAPSTIGAVFKTAGLALLALGLVLGFVMTETTWIWVMLGPLTLAGLWAYRQIQEIERAHVDDKALEEAALSIIADVTGGRVGRSSEAVAAEAHAGTALLR